MVGADPIPRLEIGGTPGRRRVLALHPGSGGAGKNWPETDWAALAGRLSAETDFHLLLIGGEAEMGRPERIAAGLPAERVEVADSLPLVELAGRLRSCAAFAGHDSGISHLAGALGVPCLLLWGDTNSDVWRPPQERVRLLRGRDGLRSLEVDVVKASLLDVAAG
jgi:heptosyltransferase-2